MVIKTKPKVRILADVTEETRDMLDEIVDKLETNRKEFFQMVIEEYYKKLK